MPIEEKYRSAISIDNALGIRSLWARTITGGAKASVAAFGGFGSHGWAKRQRIIYDFCLANEYNFFSPTCSGMHHSVYDHTQRKGPKKDVSPYDIPGIVTGFNFERWIDDGVQSFKKTCESAQVIVVPSALAEIGIRLATECPGQVAGLILVAPVTDLATLIEGRFTYKPRDRVMFEKKGYFDYPMAPMNTGDHLSYIRITRPEATAAKTLKLLIQNSEILIDCPVTILHGRNDMVVPYSSSENLQRRINGGRGVEIFDTPDICHTAHESLTDYATMLHHIQRMITKTNLISCSAR